MGWTDERVQQLRQDWAAGLSGSQIAGRMGKSRNAIIGKLHRLGLRRSTAPRKTYVRKPRRYSPSRPKSPFNSSFARQPLAPSSQRAMGPDASGSSLPVLPAQPSLDLALEALKPGLRECRFPYGDAVPFKFCGHKTIDGLPYCEAHDRLCCAPMPPSRRRGFVLNLNINGPRI